jgi:hypothetical protein
MARPFSSGRVQRHVITRSSDASTVATPPVTELFAELSASCEAQKKAPLSQKLEYSADVLAAFEALKQANAIPKWGAENLQREGAVVQSFQLKQAGIKNPDQLAVSHWHELAILFSAGWP